VRGRSATVPRRTRRQSTWRGCVCGPGVCGGPYGPVGDAVPVVRLDAHHVVELRDAQAARIHITRRAGRGHGTGPQHGHALTAAVQPTCTPHPRVTVADPRGHGPHVTPRTLDGRNEHHAVPPSARARPASSAEGSMTTWPPKFPRQHRCLTAPPLIGPERGGERTGRGHVAAPQIDQRERSGPRARNGVESGGRRSWTRLPGQGSCSRGCGGW
jgi:hypothetical protein